MKRFVLLLLLTLGMPLPVRAEVSVSLNFFVDALEPYGSWIDVEDYGYCWRPRAAEEDPDWRPYTQGHWAYTDGGWTWISDEDWGWATYHYGRWARIHSRWCWVPGYEWAPAWVSWRENEESLGWAPLPPEARWDARIGFSTWTDGYYDVGPDYYSFVPRRFFAERSLRSHYLDRGRSFASFERSQNITRIVYRKNVVNNIFIGGPQLERVDRDGGGSVQRLQLRRDTSGFQREWHEDDSRQPGQRNRGLSRIEGDELIVGAPRVDRDAKFAPPRQIAERLSKEAIDRGWRGLDSAEGERLRRSVRASAEKNRPRELPDHPEKPRTAWVAPSSPAAGRPVEEVPKSVPTERRAEALPHRAPAEGDVVPPRKVPRSIVPVPGIRPQPVEKPVQPIPPAPSGRKRGEASVKTVPSARPQPKPVPSQPKPPQENTRELVKSKPPAAAPLPPPQPTPLKARQPRKINPVVEPKVQAPPRPQPQPRSEPKPRAPAQPNATRPASSPKKAAPPSEEEAKRKSKNK